MFPFNKMKIQSILLLLVSVMLIIVSSWNLSIFIRLKDASTQYKTDEVFNEACHISKKYVKQGKIVSIVMLSISILLLMGNSVNIYHNY